MQQQKQNVLVPAKRKQMRSQRHLARKIKTDLQRSRQRTRKLTFAYRAYRKPHPPRSPSQNLLPRNPKPPRKDRTQALVALNDIPKRSFHRPHGQLATKPDRQRDPVAPAPTTPPLHGQASRSQSAEDDPTHRSLTAPCSRVGAPQHATATPHHPPAPQPPKQHSQQAAKPPPDPSAQPQPPAPHPRAQPARPRSPQAQCGSREP